jgi:hypothetical protein
MIGKSGRGPAQGFQGSGTWETFNDNRYGWLRMGKPARFSFPIGGRKCVPKPDSRIFGSLLTPIKASATAMLVPGVIAWPRLSGPRFGFCNGSGDRCNLP